MLPSRVVVSIRRGGVPANRTSMLPPASDAVNDSATVIGSRGPDVPVLSAHLHPARGAVQDDRPVGGGRGELVEVGVGDQHPGVLAHRDRELTSEFRRQRHGDLTRFAPGQVPGPRVDPQQGAVRVVPKTASLRTRSTLSTPRIRYTKTTAASRNPMIEGIEDTAMTRMASGTQNHTVATAAPMIIDAVGTTPI